MLRGLNLLSTVKPVHHKKSQLITVPRELVYRTVLDVPSYCRFLPWCNQSAWIDSNEPCDLQAIRGQRLARLSVDFKIFKESYVSKVTFEAHNYIKAVAADSDLFDNLDTVWEFKEQGDSTLIDFYITFNFRRDLYQTISSSLSHMLAKKMLDHFIKECHLRHKSDTFLH
ncbi:hypothetical protein BgAZ_102280 [Babesia gibsoni]|uniref:Coenzyme Q-binding protein COQ10 START domain-containing protein n=1 Tax=Babesia gibsoni TaxID=33632 RepID=A0AAD8PFI4_BABGI|nr:hypothetical protein BgAZ_102280 [Babesia gibsoni]